MARAFVLCCRDYSFLNTKKDGGKGSEGEESGEEKKGYLS